MFKGLENYLRSSIKNTHVDKGSKCDRHPNRPASFACYGAEEDFGREKIHQCRECHNKMLRRVGEFFFNTPGPDVEQCEGCKRKFHTFSILISDDGVKTIEDEFRNYRDIEDHLVRRLCKACVQKDLDYWAEEARLEIEDNFSNDFDEEEDQLFSSPDDKKYFNKLVVLRKSFLGS